MNISSSRIYAAGRLLIFLLCGLTVLEAQAVPSFRRQTGLECTACHLSWPELTAVGRNFKLNGYTLGDKQALPIAGMVIGSYTKTNSFSGNSNDNFPRDNEVVLQQASVFLSGKISEHFGVFSQWTYDGVAHHSAIDNTEFRYANSVGSGNDKIVFGATLHNNPTLQDVWNTTPAFRFPFTSTPVGVTPVDSALIDGGLAQQVAGGGAYVWWHKTVYAELSAYRNATHLFRWFGEGTDTSQPALDGVSPYWRLAVSQDWDDGKQSAMIGTYGAKFDKFVYPIDPANPSDRIRDTAVDAQYQYITDEHRVSFQGGLIREHRDYRASFAAGGVSNATQKFDELNLKATYYYDRKYGINLGYFSNRGDSDQTLYNTGDPITGSASGSPNSSGWIAELNWLPFRDIRFGLQYTWYNKFNGARNNYDGAGRNASDNNTLYVFGWFMF